MCLILLRQGPETNKRNLNPPSPSPLLYHHDMTIWFRVHLAGPKKTKNEIINEETSQSNLHRSTGL